MVRRAIAPFLGWDAVEHDAAWERAEALLRESLSAGQYEQYRKRGYLEIPSKLHAGRVYRVDGWRPVAVFVDGQFSGAVCIRPREALPGPDVVLARKLLIEASEEEFLRVGNWLSPAWRPATAAPSILLMALLLVPWLANLAQFGWAGLTVAAMLVAIPVMLFVRYRRHRRAAGT